MHWTLLQGEGRSADDRYNSIYRLGVEQPAAARSSWPTIETTPPVTTDCKQQSKRRLPVGRWACVEWHMEVAVARNAILARWQDRDPRQSSAQPRTPAAATTCSGEWRAPPKFDSLYIGFERYADSANDQNLWIDDVALAKARIEVPARNTRGIDEAI